jgi:hypothetical protein
VIRFSRFPRFLGFGLVAPLLIASLTPAATYGSTAVQMSAAGHAKVRAMRASPTQTAENALASANSVRAPYLLSGKASSNSTTAQIARPQRTADFARSAVPAAPAGHGGGSCMTYVCNTFAGVTFTGTTTTPPDAAVAAGPLNVMIATNGQVRIMNKSTGRDQVRAQTLVQFFSSLGPVATTDTLFDPWLNYDPYISRFWLTATSLNNNPQRSTLLIALSDTNDASGTWSFFTVNATLNGNTATSNFCDYPRTGIDAQAIYITCNMFPFPFSPTQTNFLYAKIKVMTKTQFVNNACCYWWDFWSLTDGTVMNSPPSFAVEPARMHGAVATDGEYLIDAWGVGHTGSNHEIRHITNPQNCCVPGNQTAPQIAQTTAAVQGFAQGPSAKQKGTSSLIVTGDTRDTYAFWQAGVLSTGQTVSCVSQAQTTEACVDDEEFNVSQFPTLTTVNDCIFINGASVEDDYFSGMDVNAAGKKTLAFTRSDSNDYAMALVVSIPAGAICGGAVGAETFLQAGLNSYALQVNGAIRWGDFAGVAADPDGIGIWAHGEFAASKANTWGTELGSTYEGF